MTRAFIYVGGEIFADNIYEHPQDGDLIIAADSGWDNAKTLGVTPQILLGDMDSIHAKHLDTGVEICQVPAEKDDTDTALAVREAMARGAVEIIIIGGLSGRLDHTLANLSLLESVAKAGGRALIADGQNRVRYLANNGTLLPRSGYTYFSILPIDEKVRGVEIDGGKYPLKKATLHRRSSLAVSNEITRNCALIQVKKGAVFVVESRDRLEK